MKQFPVSTIDIKGGETIAYRDVGKGPVVVLVHGNMSSSVHWQTTMDALSATHRVIAPDLRGFGDSSYHRPFDSLSDLAQDLESLLDALQVDKFALVGWSTGGGVAMEICADWPERVTQLVLLDSVPLTGYPMFKKDAAGAPIKTVPLQTKAEIAADPVQVIPALTAMQTGNRDVMRAIWNAVIYNLHQPPVEDYEGYLTAMLKQRCLVDVDHALVWFNISHRDNSVTKGNSRMDMIRCPIAILQGERDLVVPEAWARQMQEDFGERAQYISFVKAGHSVITDDPALFFDTLKGLLGDSI